MRVNHHHITYKEKPMEPADWLVELGGYEHKAISIIQTLKSTPENYARVINFLHAVMYETNRIRRDLDTQDKGDIE